MKKEKARLAQVLSETLSQYPPTSEKSITEAFRKVVVDGPLKGGLHYPQWCKIYTPGQSPKQMAEQIIQEKNKKHKLPILKGVGDKGKGKKTGADTKEKYKEKSCTAMLNKSPIDRDPQELKQTKMKLNERNRRMATKRFKELKKLRKEFMETNRSSRLENPLDDTTVNIIKHVARIAWEIAEQGMPNLWPKLHADLNCDENLPVALAKLLKRRLYGEAYHYVMTIKILRTKQGYLKDTELSQIADFLHGTAQLWTIMPGRDTPLVRRVYTIFLRQLEEYRKKYKEDMSQTIRKAIEKHRRSICRLLEWDKTWMEFDFIHNEISARGYLYLTDTDKEFLYMVGKAISKKPAIKRYTEESGLLSAIEILADRYDLSSNDKLLKSLHTLLLNEGGFNLKTEEGRNPLANFKYFKRYLKRHNIL